MTKRNKKVIIPVLCLLVVVISLISLGAVISGTSQVFLFNSKSSVAKADKVVYLGGQPIGVQLNLNGLFVQGLLPVVTKDGVVTPLADCDIKKGDILVGVNNRPINEIKSITREINKENFNNVKLTLVRDNKQFDIKAKAVVDSLTGEYKLGLSVLESIDGIGTLTFVDPEDNRFGALGHPIMDNGKSTTNNVSGNICDANIFSVYKGEKNRAGELVGNLVKEVQLGNIDKNETQGVFGTYKGDTSILKRVHIAKSKEVRPGKAQIVSSAFTGKPTYYDIEIIKACRQEKDKPKGIFYRVTDKRLIKLCGGIVQGMSGSPILQKGKLVGAVTHVFLVDSTKGYGTYIDWMIDK